MTAQKGPWKPLVWLRCSGAAAMGAQGGSSDVPFPLNRRTSITVLSYPYFFFFSQQMDIRGAWTELHKAAIPDLLSAAVE